MARIAERGIRFANFHTTALCSPTQGVAAHRAQRHHQRHGHHRRVRLRLPRASRPASPSRAASSPRCSPSTATTPTASASGTSRPARSATSPRSRAAGPSAGASSASTGGSAARPTAYYPDLVHDNHPIEPPARPEDGYHLADDLADKAIEFIRDAKVIDPDKPFFMYLAPQAGHAPHLVPLEWADRYRGVFDDGYEAIRDRHPGPPDRARAPPRGHAAVADQPPRRAGPDRARRPALADARHGPPMGHALRRREAAVHPHGGGVRRLRLLPRRPDRARCSTTWRSRGSSTTRSSSWSPTTGPAARAGPTARSTSGGSSTACPTPPTATLPHLDELGTAASNNHYNTGWAWALDTPFPYWKRWAGAEGGVADMLHRLLARAPRPPGSEPRQQYIHAVDIVPTLYELLGIEPPEVLKGYPQLPIEGESFAAVLTDPDAPGRRTQFYAMLGQRSIYHEGWLASTVHPPLSGWGNFEHDQWELFHLEIDRAQTTEPRRPGARAAGDDEGAVVLLRRPLQRPAPRRPLRARAGAGRTPPRPRRRGTRTSSTRTAPTCPSRPGRSSPAAPTRSPQGSRSTPTPSKGSSGRPAACRAATASTSRTARCATPTTGSARSSRTSSPSRPSPPGRHLCSAEFVAEGPSQDPDMPGTTRDPHPLRRRPGGRLEPPRHPTRLLLPHR